MRPTDGQELMTAGNVLLHNIPVHQLSRPLSDDLHHEESEWEAMRPFIRQIYVKDCRPLKVLIAEMNKKHNFRAT